MANNAELLKNVIGNLSKAPKSRQKQVIVPWSVSSTGKTTVGLHLAMELAKRKSDLKIGLLDMAILNPMIQYFLGLEAEKVCMEDLIPVLQASRLNEMVLLQNVHKSEVAPELHCWTGMCHNPDYADELSSDFCEQIITYASRLVDVLVVDIESDVSLVPTDIALKSASEVLVIVDQNRNVIEQTGKWLNNLHLRGFVIDKFKLVINQYSEFANYPKQNIAENLGLPLLGVVPAVSKVDYDNGLISMKPLTTNAKVEQAFIELANNYSDIKVEIQKKNMLGFNKPNFFKKNDIEGR